MRCSRIGCTGNPAAVRGRWPDSILWWSTSSTTTWCQSRSTPPRSAKWRSRCRDRPTPITGRFYCWAQRVAARQRWCGNCWAPILPASGFHRPRGHERRSPIWRFFSLRDPSGPLLRFFRVRRCSTIWKESMSAAALAAYQGNSEAEVLRRLLNHLDQRFRLVYVLGAGEPDDFDDEELSEDSIHPSAVFDLTGTRALLRSSVERLRAIAGEHVSGLRKEIEAAESDEIVREELFEDAFDKALRDDERLQALADQFMDEIERRFELLPSGELEKTKQGWPRSWSYEWQDRKTFLEVVSRLAGNYAPHFGTLLTPLVGGIRIAGPFSPRWSDNEPKLVLFDSEASDTRPTLKPVCRPQ